MHELRNRLTYANVVATVALFLALSGGVVYAAAKIDSKDIARNAVKAKQIKNGAVNGRKVAAGAIASTQVGDGSLLGKDFAAGELPAGVRGAPGPAGPAGLSGYEVVLFAGSVDPTDAGALFTVNCPPGKHVLGGGEVAFNNNIRVVRSTPNDGGDSWVVEVKPFAGTSFGGNGPSAVNVRIVCATVTEAA